MNFLVERATWRPQGEGVWVGPVCRIDTADIGIGIRRILGGLLIASRMAGPHLGKE